jgi:hypothetical protein
MNKYYAVLGLPTTASKDEIRRKYRQLVLKWHPDRNSSSAAQEKFIQITEAYDVLMGERPAPRVTYKSPKQNYSAGTKPKSRQEEERDKRMERAVQLKIKFENIRQQHLRAPDFQKRKDEMYKKANLFFLASGGVVVLSILLPLTILNIANLIWTIPVAVGAGLRFLWKGGRIKLRADMIYSGRTDYTPADIQEFFMTNTGFKFESPSGDARRW